jgi:hypothetical protein
VHRLNFTLASLLCSSVALAQTTQSPPQLSPQAAYEQATRPLEITRRSIENWSDSETAALAVAIKQAKDNCSARAPNQFIGEDLIAFARLCALGQQWPSVQDAATLYVNAQRSAGPSEESAALPGLAQAYAYQIDSSLHLNDHETALASAREMLHSVPYNELTSEATNETIHYLQLIRTPDALFLFSQRQPILLSLLHALSMPNPSAATQAKPPLPIHTLYADAIAFAALQQFANEPEAAAATIAELEAALPSTLSPDDTILIAETRRQYALLGAPLPAISPSAYLLHTSAAALPRINTNFGSATAILLFPDWCAQCIRMGSQFMPALFRFNENDVHFYALLAQAAPPPAPTPARLPSKPAPPAKSKASQSTPPPAPANPDQPKTPAELLLGTPTLVVPNDILTRFASTDFPFLVVTDQQGIVRFLQPAPDNALVPGGLLDQVTTRVVKQWPSSSAK